MTCTVVTTTWNSIDHVIPFLKHYRALGVDRMLVMDFASTDGTLDILTSSEWVGFVELAPFPGLDGLDSSNLMLSMVKQRNSKDEWCLYCDPDELLVTPSMSIHEPALLELRASTDLISIPRFNMTAPQSLARQENHRLSAFDALTLRIDRRHVPAVMQAIDMDALDPPWIYTAIPGKTMVRPAATNSIGDGDHVATTLSGTAATAPEGTYLLHYPFREYLPFQQKIELSRVFHALNPQLGPYFGWHVRRWMRLADTQGLHGEYMAQFIADDRLEALLADGTLSRDESVANFHRSRA